MKNAEKLIKAIQDEKIKPRSGMKYNFGSYGLWFGFLVSILIGAISFSIILFAIQQTEFDLLSHFSHSGLEMVLGILPYLWLVSLLIFLVLAIFSIKYTWKGYKFTWVRLVLINGLISVLLGTLFFITGGAEKLEKTFDIKVEAYTSIQERKMDIWSNPDGGMLSGTISSIQDEMIKILDFKGNTWDVIISESNIANRVTLTQGEKIKMLGEKTGENKFNATEIRPWGGNMH